MHSPVPTVVPASMGQRPLSVCPTGWESPASGGFYVSTWTPTPVSHDQEPARGKDWTCLDDKPVD